MGGGVVGSIPYSEITSYARDHLYADTPDELDEFVRIIQALDGEHLTHVNKKQTTEKKRAPKPEPSE